MSYYNFSESIFEEPTIPKANKKSGERLNQTEEYELYMVLF